MPRKHLTSTISLTVLLATFATFSNSYAADGFLPPKGSVHIASPKNGDVVASPVKVVMTSTLKLRPAGEDPNDHMTGHHHLIIDSPPIPAGEVIPTDEKHVHFGKGQTTAELKLVPGPHSITLQLADGAHRSYGSTLAETVHVVVK